MIKLTFEQERETKSTFRFEEVLEDELAEPTLGKIYVPKRTLRDLGWEKGKPLEVTIEVA